MKMIIDSGNDYLVTLKGNQPGLYKQCEAIIAMHPAVDCDDRGNHGHGRSERRIVTVWNAPLENDPLAVDASWVGLKRLIRIERRRTRTMREPSVETTYYITSRSNDSAYALGKMIRGHWAIENRLHWVKDVQQNEDNNRIRGGRAAENISLLKTWVLSLFRINGYDSIKNATISFANKISQLARLVRT